MSRLPATRGVSADPGEDDGSVGEPWRVIRPGGSGALRRVPRELWDHRELGWTLILRDLQLRFRQTLFGVGWVVLQPLTAMAAFSAIFGQVADLPSDGIPYPVFVLAGVAAWIYLSAAVGGAADSLVDHSELITKIRFPRLLAPVAAVLAAGVNLAVAILLLAPVMAIYGVAPPLAALTLPLWLLLAVLIATGAGFWLSAANVLYRDVRYALPFLLQIWLFVSPVVFPTSLVEDPWKYVFALNPAVGLIDGLRWSLLSGPTPGPELAVSVAAAFALLIGGLIYFLRVERSFADRI